jgi:hypothetical protein
VGWAEAGKSQCSARGKDRLRFLRIDINALVQNVVAKFLLLETEVGRGRIAQGAPGIGPINSGGGHIMGRLGIHVGHAGRKASHCRRRNYRDQEEKQGIFRQILSLVFAP